MQFLETAKQASKELIDSDPKLAKTENAALSEEVEKLLEAASA